MESLGGGGAERVMLNLAREFSRSGHQVDLVVASATGPYRSQVPDSVTLVDLGTTRTITAILPLAGYLRRESPDVSAVTDGTLQYCFSPGPKTCPQCDKSGYKRSQSYGSQHSRLQHNYEAA